MSILIIALALAAFAVPLGIAIYRSTELFVLDIQEGRCSLKRGRLPPALYRDIEDVMKVTAITGMLRVVVDHQEAQLEPHGEFDAGTLQRLRNVVGLYPLAKLRAGGMRA